MSINNLGGNKFQNNNNDDDKNNNDKYIFRDVILPNGQPQKNAFRRWETKRN